MKIVFFVLLSFLAIVGVSHIIFELYYRLTKIDDDSVYILLTPKSSATLDLEFALRSMACKAKMLKTKNNIICISDELDDYSLKELSLMQKDYPYLTFMKKEDFIKKAGL